MIDLYGRGIFLRLNRYFSPHQVCRSANKNAIQPEHIREILTLNPLTWKIWWAPNNASRW